MQSLTAKEKKECKIITILLVIASLLKRVDDKAGKVDANNPAVSNCVEYIDFILASKSDASRDRMTKKINDTRVRLTEKTKSMDLGSALIGAMRTLTGGYVKTSKGTHIDYIVATFRDNVLNIEKHFPFNEDTAQKFEKELKTFVRKI